MKKTDSKKEKTPAKTEAVETKTTPFPGIIATIVASIEAAGSKGITKQEILEILKAKFPDRSPEAMTRTLNVQCPNRISKERFPVKKLENGSFCKA